MQSLKQPFGDAAVSSSGEAMLIGRARMVVLGVET